MAVYQCEEYLREAVDSVIRQSIGFERIELILVDDGSSDGSGAICDEYGAAYPDHVVVIHKANGGVSSARNAGLERARGRYINFMDSDDRWSRRAFEAVSRFFDTAGDEADVAAARIRYFDRRLTYHILDYKFKAGTRLVRIDDPAEVFSIQSTVATTFIRAGAIGDLRFDSLLKFGEDSVFVNRIILQKRAYGLVKEAEYGYRKRGDDSSAVDRQVNSREYYIDSLIRYHLELAERSKALYGTVLPYIQAVIGYDLSWRADIDPETVRSVLTGEECVRCGLIDALGGLSDALGWLHGEIARRRAGEK